MASPNDMTRLVGAFKSLIASRTTFTSDANKAKAAHRLIRRTIVIPKNAADAAASTTVASNAYPGGFVAPTAGRILGVKFVAGGTVTANDTNYATLGLDVIANGAVGGPGTVTFSKATTVAGSGNLVAGQYVALTLAVSSDRYAANAVLAPSIAKTGTGFQLPAGSFVIDIEEESVDGYEV